MKILVRLKSRLWFSQLLVSILVRKTCATKIGLILGLSLLSLSIACSSPFVCNSSDEKKILSCLQALPKEDLLKNEEVMDFLAKGKIYISLTSSPRRIHFIRSTLKALDLSHVEQVLVVLPEIFTPTGESYDAIEIKKIEAFSDKIKIIRIRQDFGPITKILGIYGEIYEGDDIVRVVISNSHNIIISIDDDIGYAIGAVDQFIKHSIMLGRRYGPIVVGGFGHQISEWLLPTSLWPPGPSGCDELGGFCDVLEGFSGIAYPVSVLNANQKKMLDKVAGHPKCRVSDDLVLSYVLAQSGIGRWVIYNQFIPGVSPFPYGLSGDALHAEGNQAKYRECLDYMASS